MLSRKGQFGGTTGQVLSIAVIAMVLLISVTVYANFDSSIDRTGMSTQAQQAINATSDNAYSGFDLAAVLPIAIAGVAVLLIVVRAFMGLRQR